MPRMGTKRHLHRTKLGKSSSETSTEVPAPEGIIGSGTNLKSIDAQLCQIKREKS